MKKFTFTLFIILSLPLLAAEAQPVSLNIKGVSGTALLNVEKHLNELQQLRPLEEIGKDELANQILKALQPFGYFRARVETLNLNNNKLSASIYTGPQMHIIALKIELIGEGAQNPALLNTISQIDLHVNDPLLIDAYNKAKQTILTSAENLGYLHGSFQKAEVLIDENANTAQITLVFNTGSLYYFGQVQFDPTNINPELLHRFIPFHPGQAYSTEQILKLNNQLSDSGYFSSVLVKPQITEEQTVPVLVHLEPAAKYTYTLGAGYGTDTGIRGRAGLNIVPINRRGHKFHALAQGSFTQNALQAQYVIPGQNPVYDQFSVTGNASTLNYSAGYGNALLLSLAQQHKLEFYKRVLSINGLYESYRYSYLPNNSQFMLYPKASFAFTKAKSQLFSPSGYNITINTLGASKLTLSQINFVQVSVDAKAAYMIEALRLRLYGHTIQGITATSTISQLPLSLALLLGGMDNLKAYSFNSIGPGRIITYTGFEIQKETKKNWYLIGFIDSGDVYNPLPRALRYDAGAGVMWVSPIGPIKLGLAQAINNRFQRTSPNPRLIISMGPDL